MESSIAAHLANGATLEDIASGSAITKLRIISIESSDKKK
jgi:hypothetical protein